VLAGWANPAALATPLLALALAACGAVDTRVDVLAGAPCGAAAARTLAAADGAVGKNIYEQELAGPNTVADQRQVERYRPLLRALAAGNRMAVHEAVTRLVYSHTHIVRLRVLQGAAAIADVGGPHVIAPVRGELRYRGRTVGRYMLSVQDDIGYVGLVHRLIGVPLMMRLGSRRVPLVGTLTPGAARTPGLGPFHYHGASYEAVSFDAKAFPAGVLRISLFVPWHRSGSGKSCAAIRVAELGRVARRVWTRWLADSYPVTEYAAFNQSLTGGLTIVGAGAGKIAGTTRPGAPDPPVKGTVTYRGVSYGVSSFAAVLGGAPVRVYQLVVP